MAKKKTSGIFIKADEDVKRMADILRDKHSINLSHLLRSHIAETYRRLECGDKHQKR